MDYSGASNTKELHYVLKSSIMLRRLKRDVLSQLPPKVRQRIEVQPEERLLRHVKRILHTFLEDLEDNPEEKKNFLQAINKDSEEGET
jgi:hypothetical protein